MVMVTRLITGPHEFVQVFCPALIGLRSVAIRFLPPNGPWIAHNRLRGAILGYHVGGVLGGVLGRPLGLDSIGRISDRVNFPI